jgi:hypothetical protein
LAQRSLGSSNDDLLWHGSSWHQTWRRPPIEAILLPEKLVELPPPLDEGRGAWRLRLEGLHGALVSAFDSVEADALSPARRTASESAMDLGQRRLTVVAVPSHPARRASMPGTGNRRDSRLFGWRARAREDANGRNPSPVGMVDGSRRCFGRGQGAPTERGPLHATSGEAAGRGMDQGVAQGRSGFTSTRTRPDPGLGRELE